MGPLLVHAAVAAAALGVSVLTLYSGFGLGTILMPVFALFVPVPVAVAATAVVHLANNVLKVAVVGRQARRDVALRFGIPAVAAAFAGALLLEWLAGAGSLGAWDLAGTRCEVTILGLAMGTLFVAFASLELSLRTRDLSFPPGLLPVGGAVSGFFGGLSGHQGALRSAFLSRSGLEPAAFVGTTAVISLCVDLARLSVYGAGHLGNAEVPWGLVGTAIGGAFAGVLLGVSVLKSRKVTLRGIQVLTGVLLALFGILLAAGVI